jgi:ligand-binding SRPBCC domain-containing protein
MTEAVNRTSRVEAPAPEVWTRVTSPEGINDELRPWMRMTMPRSLRGRTIAEVEPGQLGRSWILLFGFLPFDYDDLGLAELEAGRRFLERSTMLSMRRWEHERTVDPAGPDGCEVTDRIAFELRAPLRVLGLTRPVSGVLRRFFAHRHRRLARRYASGS